MVMNLGRNPILRPFRNIIVAALVLLLAPPPPWSNAFPHFANQIPNGKTVPNPNPQGGIWAGVGHLKAGGGGPLNPFGEAFRANQFTWTDELCRADSDGDGRTNGAELGDLECVWIAPAAGALDGDGDDKVMAPALSHPGIVDEPLSVAPKTSCSDYEQPDQAVEYDIKFSRPVSIDETRTHYVCEQMDLPVPGPELFHKIKSSILLDNRDVLHHMFVFFCFTDSLDGNRAGQGPYECGGTEARCTRFAGWAVGPEDTCLPSFLGDEVDFTGMGNVTVKIEAHYDNASGMAQQDQSGMRLVLTPELRPLSSATAVLGIMTMDNNFELPPLQPSYMLTNICPSEATAKLPHPIYAYAFAPHMHLFGRSLYTEHYRCGVKIGEIGRASSYEFDNQQSYALRTPVKILPGDALITTCEYNTSSSDVALLGGEETTAEMCLNFVHYFPAPDVPFRACTSFENGLAVDRLETFQISSMANRTAQLALMADARFAIAGGGNGTQSLVFRFESDPTKAWAACCDTNSCEEQYLESVGGVCGTDGDCASNLVCLSGFCSVSSERPTTIVVDSGSNNSSDGKVPVEEEATDDTEQRSGKALPGDWAVHFVGAALVHLLMTFFFW